jgi:hypothetical protein
MGWSYSHYSALRKCGRYYQLSVIEKRPQDPNVNFEFGTAMHTGLHSSLNGGDADQAFIDAWNKVKWLDMAYQRHDWDTLGATGLKFLGTFRKKYGVNMKPLLLEKRLYAKLGEIELEGTPDALVEWEGKNVLIDYKTSAYNYLFEKTPTSLQLYLYSFLLEQNGFKVDSICYFVFNKGTGTVQTPVIFDIDKEVREEMLKDLGVYIEKNSTTFSKNPLSCIQGSIVCPFINECYKTTKEESAQ